MWRGDNRELVYIAPDGTFMSVRVASTGPKPFGEPVSLFQARVRYNPSEARRQDMTSDGQRFVVELEDETPEPLILIDNWSPTIATVASPQPR